MSLLIKLPNYQHYKLNKLQQISTITNKTTTQTFHHGNQHSHQANNRNFVEGLQVKPLCYFVLYLTKFGPKAIPKVPLFGFSVIFLIVCHPSNNFEFQNHNDTNQSMCNKENTKLQEFFIFLVY